MPPFKGSNTVELLYCEGFLKYDIIRQLCFPRISPHGGLFEGGLFGGGGRIRGFTVYAEHFLRKMCYPLLASTVIPGPNLPVLISM